MPKSTENIRSTHSDDSNSNENENENENEKHLFFGQSVDRHRDDDQHSLLSSNAIKRTLSNESNSLSSLTKKVLIIENDRLHITK